MQYNNEQAKKKQRYNVEEENRRRKNEKKEKMLELIASNEPIGLSTPQLSELIPCHPDTVLRRGNELMYESRVFKTGKFGKYHLTARALGDPELGAIIFRSESVRGIINDFSNYDSKEEDRELEKKAMDERDESLLQVIDERSKERAAEANDLISKEKRFWKEHFPEFEDIAILQQRCNSCGFAQDYHFPQSISGERKSLLEFAMDIGILITYIMMEAVRPRHNKKRVFDSKDSNDKKEIEVDLLLGEKKRQAELWVKNAIGPIDIFQEFLKLPIVKKGLALDTKEYFMPNLNPGLSEKRKKELLAEQRFAVPSDPTWSPHEMDKENFKKLISTYYDIWPWTYSRLEDIKGKLPYMLESGYKIAKEFDAKSAINLIREKRRIKKDFPYGINK